MTSQKKKTSSGKKRGARGHSIPLPDRTAMEGVLSMFGGGRKGKPIDEAQDLMYQAWESPNPQRGIELAKKALAISTDCADAYVLLAQAAPSLSAATDLYRQGVEAGERAVGKRAFKEDVGHFWGLLETRPYMRARQGLAKCLWVSGQHEDAVGHYREMLRLNPNDNQGLRYVLAACLLDMGGDDELAALLEAFHDDASATWAYSAALLAFRTTGDSPKSQKRRAEAKKTNPHVPAYLTGKKRMPKRLPDYVGFGDENEAIAYVGVGGSGWKKTPGAVEWLATS